MTKKLDPVAETIATYNQVATAYQETYAYDFQKFSHLYESFFKLLTGKVILDAGCGFGRESQYFTEKGYDVTAIDLSTAMLELTRNNAPQAKILKMDIRNLEFPDQTFDGIWAMMSILHLPKNEVPSTLNEFNRVLKPKGGLYISVKLGNGEEFVSKGYYKNQRKFFSYYQVDELEQLLKNSGFISAGKPLITTQPHGTIIDLFALKN